MIVTRERHSPGGPQGCPYGMGRCTSTGGQCPCHQANLRGLGLTLPGGIDLSQTVTIPGLNITVSIQSLLIGAAVLGVAVFAFGLFGGKRGARRKLRRAQLQYAKDRASALLAA